MRRNSHRGPLPNESWEKPTLGWIKLNYDALIDIGGRWEEGREWELWHETKIEEWLLLVTKE
jgi:hypothetical protein